MQTPLGYRLLSHVTLAVSCVCLVHAELFFMPELQFALLPLLALVLVACFAEGRWVLPVWGANLLGLVIAAGGAWWMAFQLGQSDNPLLDVPLPSALVPHFGPVLMALLLVLLFRPRSPGHFWLVQGIGLLQVALACLLATGWVFGLLLAAYLAGALGCLVLHHHYGDPEAAAAPRTGRGFGPVRLGSWMLRWTLGVGLAGMLLFLFTPRVEGPVWDPEGNFGPPSFDSPVAAKTGVSEQIDLNRSGTIELDEEVAFTVTAGYSRNRPKEDLPGDQRWRSVILDRYENGRWSSTPRLSVRSAGVVVVPNVMPEVGPDQFILSYTVTPRKAGGFFLADPVRTGRGGRVPVVMPGQTLQQLLYYDAYDAVIPNRFLDGPEYHYNQVVPPPSPDDDRRPAEDVLRLADQYPPGLERWTLDLLRRLAADPDYGLAGIDLAAPDGAPAQRPVPSRAERIARALERYLARSGDYAYSLDLRHEDPTLDPALDFLVNVRQGPCACYATALALMLRSQGIPAQVVNGYRGAESQGGGVYVIRHRDAHSWVEALVEARAASHPYDWLTLDPTPEGDAPPPRRFSLLRWLMEHLRDGQDLWKDLVLNYDADHQADMWDALAGRPLALGGAVATAAVAAWLLLRRGWPGRRKRTETAWSFYPRMVELLTRHARLQPQPAQTPREFGEAARAALLGRPAAASLADLPGRVTDLFYRVRFGDLPLGDEEARVVRAELDQLAVALRR
jgi:transglutaminase-like putative cysteine protease